VEGSPFDEAAFFRAVAASGARAMLIGRRALVALGIPDGIHVAFDALWSRRRSLEVAAGVVLAVPALPDLILTKRFGGRPKDFEDIRLLEALRREEGQ
jgi:hypothetical protein